MTALRTSKMTAPIIIIDKAYRTVTHSNTDGIGITRAYRHGRAVCIYERHLRGCGYQYVRDGNQHIYRRV